jgi:hypothetical protein
MSTADARGLRLIAHSDLGDCGDGFQMIRHQDALYVGHLGDFGMATTVLDVGDVSSPRVVKQFQAPPGTHSHKVQVADGLLLANEEQYRGANSFSASMLVYDVADPFDPKPIGKFESGGLGVHRLVYRGGRYAYVSATPDGFETRIWVIIDLDDPEKPVEAGRWWYPGQWIGGGETPGWPAGKKYAAHHALLDGNVAFLGCGDANLVILDVTDVGSPSVVSELRWSPGGDTHTAMPLPGRDLLVVTDEAVRDDCAEEEKLVRIVDISDLAHPEVVSICPPPDRSHCARGLRFGPHNLHENYEDSYRSATLVFVTYFNAGLRVYDVTDPTAPVEVGFWEPEPPAGQKAPQINDLFVDAEQNIYVTDRFRGGLYILTPEGDLAQAMEDARL